MVNRMMRTVKRTQRASGGLCLWHTSTQSLHSLGMFPVTLNRALSSSSISQHHSDQKRRFSSSVATPSQKDCIVVGGGPVGACAAWFLAESEAKADDTSILLVHDPKNRGAHEDWSRLARLSFDGPRDEMDLSRHAVGLLDLIEEVRSMNSGAPVVPLRPGMLFVASPGTNLAKACANGEGYGDADFVRREVSELEALYPGHTFNLPADTLCWTHPDGLCVSPLELADAARKTSEAYGVEVVEARAQIDMAPEIAGANLIRVTLDSGEVYDTRRCFLFTGATGKQLIDQSLQRCPSNSALQVPEFDTTYITAISTVRYKHNNHPSQPAPGSGHVVTPIILGQLEVPDVIGWQANFSIVAEEYGDVLKTRLSGSIGSEVIETVADMHKMATGEDAAQQEAAMASTYQQFFGTLFPFLDTRQPLDFNRCVTYRNHNPNFSGTSLVHKTVGDASVGPTSSLMITPGCFGVGVKFGPALGQAAAAYTFGQDLELGMNVFESGLEFDDINEEERIERAW